MLNTGQGPHNGENASTLSQILQANAPEKYYLSAKACAGILRRAEKRGKELPKMLKDALEEVVKLSAYSKAPSAAPTLKSVLSGGNTIPDTVYQNTGIGWWNEARVAETLRTPCGGDSTKANIVVYDARGNGGGDTVPTLTGDHQNRVTDYTAVCVGNGQMQNITMQPISNALDCMHDQQAVTTEGEPPRRYIVRRLTPLEYCRLQGFPDWWEDGVEGSDSARYKMWGNGIALPCAADVLGRIAKEMENVSACQ